MSADALTFLGLVIPREHVGLRPTAPYVYVPLLGQMGVMPPLTHWFTSSSTTGAPLVFPFFIAHCAFAMSMSRRLLMQARCSRGFSCTTGGHIMNHEAARYTATNTATMNGHLHFIFIMRTPQICLSRAGGDRQHLLVGDPISE